MLGRKVSGSGMMMMMVNSAAAAAGGSAAAADRARVAERLHAALAGLQELQLLKEKQGDMVHRALTMDHRRDEEPITVSSSSSSAVLLQGRPNTSGTTEEEQRLEASLTALKQQLCRLRRQDVGLKTHLQQLDQQISELKLDTGKVSTEQQQQQLESDSRPSSGFYELSDGGSCSLSNSCTSVYSECLSSSSQTSLLLAVSSPTSPTTATTACHARVGGAGPPSSSSSSSQADACRRRSADETVAPPPNQPPRGAMTGVHLGSSRIRVGVAARPRPVSTGDLDRVMTLGLGCYKSAWEKKSSPCTTTTTTNLKTSAVVVDPKFQNNLVSRSGTEVYQYPSPLHAVALQSPIFALDGVWEPATNPRLSEGPAGPRQADAGIPVADAPPRRAPEALPLGYIDRVLRRSMSKINIHGDAGRDTLVRAQQADYHTGEVQTTSPPDVPNVQASSPPPLTSAQTPPDAILLVADSHRNRRCVGHSPGKERSVRAPEVSHRYSYPAAMRDYDGSGEVVTCAARNDGRIPADSAVPRTPYSEKRHRDVPTSSRGAEKKGLTEQRHLMNHSSSAEESHGFEAHHRVGHNNAPSTPDFVHAKFVPAGSQRVKVRQADRKPKAVKLRRRSSTAEKPKTSRHPQGYSERESVGGGGLKGRSGKAKVAQRLTSCYTEERMEGHSGSDSSLYNPGLMHTHRVYPNAKPHPVPPVGKCSGKGRRTTQCPEPEQPSEPRKRRQGAAAKWPTDVDVHCVQQQRQRPLHTQALVASRPAVRSASTRSHSDHWAAAAGPRRAFQPPSVSPASFFGSLHLNARYPPAPFLPGQYPPPRCESEYSAECASLFHSTIAESSEGETSDGTTNRFGDSSDSSDSSLSEEEEEEEGGGLVWPEASVGPTAAGLALQQQRPLPEPTACQPPACRIKASRALKKKIRRFQPAGMKVMTLV